MSTNPTDIIEDARSYASESFDGASNLVDNAVRIANSSVTLNPPGFPVLRDISEFELPDLPDDEVPSLDRAQLDRPDSPTLEPAYKPQLPDFDSVQRPAPLDFENLFDFQLPDTTLPSAPGEAPSINVPSFPDAPELTFPDKPGTIQLTFPSEPSVTTPSFDPQRPESHPGAPPDGQRIIEATYDSVLPEMRAFLEQQVENFTGKISPDNQELMRKLEQRLDEMAEGGTALTEDIEQAIFDRTRRRAETQRKTREDEAFETAAQRGFSLPPGILQAALHRASTEASGEITTAASEVAIEMARLEQQNIQFALQTMASLRQTVLNSALQYAGTLAQVNAQASEHARGVAAAAAETYNASVNIFNSEVNYFQAQAQVYEVELRAAFAELEKYQALVRVEELKSNVNSQLIQQYRSEIEAQQARIQAYTSEVQALATQVDADRARVEAFGQEVSAYSAQVSAKEAELRTYLAALEGDQAKVRGYTAQVEAFNSEIRSLATQVEAESTYSEAIGRYNQTRSNIFASEMQAYGVDVQAASSIYEADIRRFISQLEQYQTQVQGLRTQYEGELERARLEFEKAQTQYRTQADIGIEQGRLFLQRSQNAADAAVSGANVYASIASAAVSAQNTMVSLSREILEEGTT